MENKIINEELLLNQWQTCVEMANEISHRRDTMNNLFVTINIALIAMISYVWSIKTIFVSLIGIVFCIVWIRFIINFKMLNEEKFKIINEMENQLPVKPFNNEWNKLQSNKKYTDGTTIEYILPSTFIIAYIIISIILFVKK